MKGMGRGVKAQRGDNRGKGLPNFAFSKGDIGKTLGKSKKRGIGRKRKQSNHGLNGSNRTKGGRIEDRDLYSGELGLFLQSLGPLDHYGCEI